MGRWLSLIAVAAMTAFSAPALAQEPAERTAQPSDVVPGNPKSLLDITKGNSLAACYLRCPGQESACIEACLGASQTFKGRPRPEGATAATPAGTKKADPLNAKTDPQGPSRPAGEFVGPDLKIVNKTPFDYFISYQAQCGWGLTVKGRQEDAVIKQCMGPDKRSMARVPVKLENATKGEGMLGRDCAAVLVAPDPIPRERTAEIGFEPVCSSRCMRQESSKRKQQECIEKQCTCTIHLVNDTFVR